MPWPSNLENSFDIDPTLSGMIMFILVGAALMGALSRLAASPPALCR